MPSPSVPSPSTVRSLAKTLGLSRTTVSDALRGLPRVAAATVQRVRKAAREAGYQRNPLVAGLMSEMRQSRVAMFRGVLAAVEIDESQRPAYSAHFNRELVLGASTRAEEMGFKVAAPETNILLVPVPDAPAAVALLAQAQVRVLPVGSALRFITHRDLSHGDVREAIDRIRPLAERMVTTWEGDRPMV